MRLITRLPNDFQPVSPLACPQSHDVSYYPMFVACADQPDAMVAFRYEGVWIGFANVFNPTNYYDGQGPPPPGGSGATPVGTVNGVLTWSPDARHWHYIQPLTSFVPRGDASKGAFDCCGIFMAKQDPTKTPAWVRNTATTVCKHTQS